MERKPKIFFILHLPPPVHGSAMVGKYIKESRVVNEMFECHYLNLATARDLNDLGRIGFHKMKNYFHLLYLIWKGVRHERPDLCYVTPNAKGGAFYKDFVIVLLLRILKQNIVLHYHNKGITLYQNRLFDHILYRFFFKKVKVILLAENLYQDIKKYVKRENVFICPNGIPALLDGETERENDRFHILFLSNLIRSKGLVVLLDACQILKDKGFDFTCEIVGGETQEFDRSILNEAISQRNLEGHVVYCGQKFGSEKEKYFQSTDLFVLPTFYHNECFPIVLLEAMKHGLPCISTDEGGISAIIDDYKTGFIVEKKNPLQLAEKIQFFLENPHLAQIMGNAAQEKFFKNFTLEKFEWRITSIFQSLIH